FGELAASDVAFRWAGGVVASTLSPERQIELAQQPLQRPGVASDEPQEIQIGKEGYLSSTVSLSQGAGSLVSLTVLRSLDKPTLFLAQLNRILIAIGLLTILLGSAIGYFISETIARPLGDLVAGVRALEHGDFTFPVKVDSTDEVSVVTGAFVR